MNIAQAISNLFTDRRWVEKIGIGALIMMVPVLNFAAMGVQVRVIRQVKSDFAEELPDWDDLVALWREGLWIALASTIYSLPFFLILAGAGFMGIPLLIALVRNPDTSWIPYLLVCGTSVLLMMAYSVAISVVGPVILGNYAKRGTFAACFDWPEFVRLIANSPSAYGTLCLTLLAMGILFTILSVIVLFPVSLIPFLGQALSPLLYSAGMFLMMLAQASLIGQWLHASERGEARASPVEAPV